MLWAQFVALPFGCMVASIAHSNYYDLFSFWFGGEDVNSKVGVHSSAHKQMRGGRAEGEGIRGSVLFQVNPLLQVIEFCLVPAWPDRLAPEAL